MPRRRLLCPRPLDPEPAADDDGDDEEEGDAAAAASRKAQIDLNIQRQSAADDRRDYLSNCDDGIEITVNKVANNSFTVLMATVNKNDDILFYARYDMENANGERVVGPPKRVARNGLDGVGVRVFRAAIDRMTHPDYSKDPFIDFGRGSKAPTVASITPSVAAYHPTGPSPHGGVGDDPDLHVDPQFHCVGGCVYNLLLPHYPTSRRSSRLT